MLYCGALSLDERTRHELVKDTAMIFQGFNLLSNLNVNVNDDVLLPTKLRKGNKEDNIRKTAF